MSEPIYLAGDFSGIQDYVLGVKSAGGAQAKRLRARSFLLELFEYAALAKAKERLGISEDDVLIRGGGGFLARADGDADRRAVDELNAELQRMVWDETGGGVQASLVWGETPEDARARLERRKRRPAFSALQNGGAWSAERMSLPPLGDPCEVCGQAPGQRRVQDADGDGSSGGGELHCAACLKARNLGERLTSLDWMRVLEPGGGSGGGFRIEALGATFGAADAGTPDAFRAGRWIPRSDNGREPLTFEEIAEQATGDKRLAALKADVDDMGVRVGEIADADPSLATLKSFSRDLHAFFAETIQDTLAESWRSIYTIYAGGDDLLLIGPWDKTLDFAGKLASAFEEGPGRKYAPPTISAPLTLSAGIALFPYRLPVRHAAERANALESMAKARDGKNGCAALESEWSWEYHGLVIGEGKKLARWTRELDGFSRSLLHRLLRLAESDEPTRAARWTYQTERNVRGTAEFRGWATEAALALERDAIRANEISASLRYALLATRG